MGLPMLVTEMLILFLLSHKDQALEYFSPFPIICIAIVM